MTHREVALYLGFSARTVFAWESRTRRLPLGSVRPLAACLGMPTTRIAVTAGLSWPALRHPSSWQDEQVSEILSELRQRSGCSAPAFGRRLNLPGWRIRSRETGMALSPGSCQRLEIVRGLTPGTLAGLAAKAGEAQEIREARSRREHQRVCGDARANGPRCGRSHQNTSAFISRLCCRRWLIRNLKWRHDNELD
jgi:DNA-binding transcriptional regulator YiaG